MKLKISAKKINTTITKIYVKNDLGISCQNEPVRVSVPFSFGKLKNPDELCLTNENAEYVPAQFALLGDWQDGSVKWLSVDFQVSLKPREKKVFFLKREKKKKRISGIIIKEEDDYFKVDTGSIKFKIGKKRFCILGNLSIKGDKGSWRQISERGLSSVFTDWPGRDDRTDNENLSVELTNHGPLHTIITVKSPRLRQKTNEKWLYEEFELHLYANKPHIRIFHRFENRRLDDVTPIARARLSLSIDSKLLLFITQCGGKLVELDKSDNISILQTGPTTANPSEKFLCKISEIKQNCKRVLNTFSKNNGLITVKYKDCFVTSCIKDFWQQHPKGFTLMENSLFMDLYPNDVPPLLFPMGMAKTHEILLAFYQDEQPAKAECCISNSTVSECHRHSDLNARFQQPLVPFVNPEYFIETRVMGNLPRYDKRNFISYEKLLRKAAMDMLKNREKYKEYGILDFGDDITSPSQPTFWQNNEYDLPHIYAMLFVRTGDKIFFNELIRTALHFMDIDIIHNHRDEQNIYAECKHDVMHSGHQHEGGHVGMHPCHTWLEGFLDYFYLTGRKAGLDIAEKVGKWILKYGIDAGMKSAEERKIGWPLIAMISMYNATHDPDYLNASKELVKDACGRPAPDGHPNRKFIKPDGTVILGTKCFMLGVLLDGMTRYHRLTGDLDCLHFIIMESDWMCKNAWIEKDGGFYYSPLEPDRGRPADNRELIGLCYAFSHSGDRKFIECAIKNFAAGLKARKKESFDTKSFATFVRGTLECAAFLQENNLWSNDKPKSKNS